MTKTSRRNMAVRKASPKANIRIQYQPMELGAAERAAIKAAANDPRTTQECVIDNVVDRLMKELTCDKP